MNFEEYLGQALHVARVAQRLYANEVFEEINRRANRKLTAADFEALEHGRAGVPELFTVWCEVLGVTQVRVLKIAQHLEAHKDTPGQELLKETRKEIEYLLWKEKQK